MDTSVIGFFLFLFLVFGFAIASLIRRISPPASETKQAFGYIASRILSVIAIISLLLAHAVAGSIMPMLIGVLAGIGALFCLLFSRD